MSKRCIQKIFEKIFISFCVILCMQLPFFLVQYTHQLKGHIDELCWQVEHMKKSALLSGKNLDQYISKFMTNSDRDFASQGIMMHNVTNRFEKLSKAWMQLNSCSPFKRPFVFLRYLQSDVFYATLSHFKMGISFASESLVFGLIGIFIGSGLSSFLGLFYRRKKRYEAEVVVIQNRQIRNWNR